MREPRRRVFGWVMYTVGVLDSVLVGHMGYYEVLHGLCVGLWRILLSFFLFLVLSSGIRVFSGLTWGLSGSGFRASTTQEVTISRTVLVPSSV